MIDKPVPEQGSSAPQRTRIYQVILSAISGVIKWLAIFTDLTEEEREDAGIPIERMDGE